MKIYRIVIVFLAAVGLVIFGIGEVLTRPASHLIGNAPADLQAVSIAIPISPSRSVAGWFIRGNPGAGGVLLLHGVRSDRRQMVDRARFLHKDGYSVLLIDLPAHGKSSGERITFGAREAEGVIFSLRYLREQLNRDEKIAVIGVSLGAASLVMSRADPPPSAVVLESMYPTITEAVEDRLALHAGWLGQRFAPVLLWQLPLRLGISANELRPIDLLPSLQAPVLIAAGDQDMHTKITETKRLFGAARQPKDLWIVEGAAHVDLYKFAPAAYEKRVGGFLVTYLHKSVPEITPQAITQTQLNSPPK